MAKGYMYRSLKKEDGTYSFVGYIHRAIQLTGAAELKKYFATTLPDAGPLKRVLLSIDYYGCLIRYGAAVCDYFEYEFWKKKGCVRKQYITKVYSRKIQKKFNTGSIEPLSNKSIFNEYFQEFRGDITCFYFDRSEEEFLSFVRECGREIIAKPMTGYSGRGIYKPDVSTDEKAREAYRELKGLQSFFAEKVLHQTGILHEIHPYSVNTIRMYTLYDKRDVRIMFAAARFGGSKKPVDNIHSGGFSCEIDLESGCIIGRGYDLIGNSYFRHPMSGKLILGVQVPNWEGVCDLVIKAAKKLPDVGYVGWDVAVGDDMLCLIEGNECANVDVSQVCAQRGLKSLYAPYL